MPLELADFRDLIQNRKEQLEETSSVSETGTQTVELDQTKVGRLSRMDALQMQQMNLEAERRRSRELVALDHALNRIEDGSYGICAECEELINPKRLEIDLTAVLCITCANRQNRE